MILQIKYQYGREMIHWKIYCDLKEEQKKEILGKLGEIIKSVEKIGIVEKVE